MEFCMSFHMRASAVDCDIVTIAKVEAFFVDCRGTEHSGLSMTPTGTKDCITLLRDLVK